MILHRYFARRFLNAFFGVFAVLFMIMLFLDLVEQLRRFTNVDARFSEILVLTLLNTPQGIYTILPLIMILATITLFLSLARSSEMVVTRAAGRSALRALIAPLLMAFLIGLMAVAAVNPIVAATSREYEKRSNALRGESAILSLAGADLWLRQGDDDGQAVIRAQKSNLDGTVLSDVTFVIFAGAAGPVRRIEAKTARLAENAWILSQAKSWALGAQSNQAASAQLHDTLEVPTTLTVDEIRDSFGAPSSISIWDLPQFIARLKTAGFSAQRHEMWFQSELAQPFFLVAMMMIGACFTLRHQRGGRTGLMVLMAIVLSFIVYFLRNFANVLGENGELPAVLAAWAPPLAAIGLSLGILLHNEDG